MTKKAAKLELLHEQCWYCYEPFENGKPTCSHPEVTPEVTEAAGILAAVDFCDHFCCGMPPTLCEAVRLAAVLRERDNSK